MTELTLAQGSPVDLAVAGWIHSKYQLSKSDQTRRVYKSIIDRFRAALLAVGLDLDHADPVAVATVAQGWAGTGDPAPDTFNQRLAALSSFYAYARRMGFFAGENPIERVERAKVERYKSARALDMADLRQALQAIDRTTPTGRRDYALLLVALRTGRRSAELAGLRWGDLKVSSSGTIVVTWRRCKGGKVKQDTLTGHTARALLECTQALHGKKKNIPPTAPIWASTSNNNEGAAITPRAITDICEARLGTGNVHALRHTFAAMMLEAGANTEQIRDLLGHESLETTGIYLRKLQSSHNPFGDALEDMLGL